MGQGVTSTSGWRVWSIARHALRLDTESVPGSSITPEEPEVPVPDARHGYSS